MIQTLFLSNFRSHESKTLSFSPNINLILGKNGVGKTNILEAISLISTGRSFRTDTLAETIQENSQSFLLKASLLKDEREEILSIAYNGKEKKLLLEGQTLSSFSPLLGYLPAVILAPEDHALMDGAPRLRRKFLDLQLAQLYPLYTKQAVRYHQALLQRNHLLKIGSLDGIESFEAILQEEGNLIQTARENLLKAIEPLFQEAVEKISSEEVPALHYLPSKGISYANSREKERIVKKTLWGPHRDDFIFILQGKEATVHASQGQKRTLLTLLKLSLWSYLKNRLKKTPLLCIDDFTMHLDEERSYKILEILSSCDQIFLTAPDVPPPLKQIPYHSLML